MCSLKLIRLNNELKEEYLDMIEEYKLTNERIIPSTISNDSKDFSKLLNKLDNFSNNIDLPKELVPSTLYFLVNDNNRILGAIDIRHKLNDALKFRGGHIGYGIRPSERKKGYATAMLKMGIEKAKEIGINKALITCDKNNIGSSKTIINNGGILDSEDIFEGNIFQRYWINI